MEDTERDNSPDLSESFEIYLEQKKKKIEMEKNMLNNGKESENLNFSGRKNNFLNSSDTSIANDLSYNNDSFIELERMCENTLNLNNVSEALADLTYLEIKVDSKADNVQKIDPVDEAKLQGIDHSSFDLNNTSNIMEATSLSSSYKTTHSQYPSVRSIMSSDRSEYYRTANDKSIELMKNISKENSFNSSEQDTESYDLKFEKKKYEPDLPSINDTLDEIEFLLSQAQKLNDQNDILQETKVNNSPLKYVNTPKSENKQIIIHTPNTSPLISFSPFIENKSPLVNFKHPKAVSSSKNSQFLRANNKKFQHIVSPVSRYIQTSESVLNANAHVHYKGIGAKRQFNFRDSENFDRTHDVSVKASSLPLRIKTNANTQKSSEKEKQTTQNKFKNASPTSSRGKNNTNLPRNANFFFDNTFNDLETTAQNF
ncbi:GATA zinc finger domain-containing protein 7-like isoform X2 [Chironomus tepperi]